MSWIVAALIWIALGAVVGFIAARLMGMRIGPIGSIIAGALGSVVGGVLAGLLGLAYGGIWNFVVALAGACIVLVGVRLIGGK